MYLEQLNFNIKNITIIIYLIVPQGSNLIARSSNLYSKMLEIRNGRLINLLNFRTTNICFTHSAEFSRAHIFPIEKHS